MVELFLNRFQVVEDIGVVELKVVEDQRSRAVMDKLRTFVEEGAVILVCFDNKEVTFAQRAETSKFPVHHRSQNRVYSRTVPESSRHSRRGRFAVCTGNGQHPAVTQHKIVQPLRT